MPEKGKRQLQAEQTKDRLFYAADALLAELCREGLIRREGERYAMSDFAVHYTKRQTAIKAKLLDIYEKAGIEPGTVEEISVLFAANEKADLKQVLDSVLSSGELIMLSPQLCYSPSAYGKALEAAKALFAENETVTFLLNPFPKKLFNDLSS